MRQPQFSLKALLWLMAVVAIGCVSVPPAWRMVKPYFFPPPVAKGGVRIIY